MKTISKVWLTVLVTPFASMIPFIYLLDYLGIPRANSELYFAGVICLFLLGVWIFVKLKLNEDLEFKSSLKRTAI